MVADFIVTVGFGATMGWAWGHAIAIWEQRPILYWDPRSLRWVRHL